MHKPIYNLFLCLNSKKVKKLRSLVTKEMSGSVAMHVSLARPNTVGLK